MEGQKYAYIGMMREELEQLSERHDNLHSFICSPAFKDLPQIKQALLSAQSGAMASYRTILTVRLKIEMEDALKTECDKITSEPAPSVTVHYDSPSGTPKPYPLNDECKISVL